MQVKKITLVKSNKPNTPSELDRVIHKKIKEYTQQHSMKELSRMVDKFVREQYKDAHFLVANGELDPVELNKDINLQIPSTTYISDYVKGRPICYRYTNTLANFFSVEYGLFNHNPSDELIKKTQLSDPVD